MKKTPAEEEGFDARLARLEGIVAELERGDLGLEASLERYQQGVELLRQCHGVLQSYKKQVQELGAGAEDALKPYAGDPDAR
jgi:exodeoxyribonuclease VII small subunit